MWMCGVGGGGRVREDYIFIFHSGTSLDNAYNENIKKYWYSLFR